MIYRQERKAGTFIQIDKNIAEDNNISALAKGILLYMLSKNDDWQFYESEIKAHFTDSIKVVSKGIKELINKGYIQRIKIKGVDGRFVYNYDIYETPQVKANEYTYMPYTEYLETNYWKETRKIALNKANYKCQLCSNKNNLNVHHNTYKNKGSEKCEDLIVLCEECHAKFHNKL